MLPAAELSPDLCQAQLLVLMADADGIILSAPASVLRAVYTCGTSHVLTVCSSSVASTCPPLTSHGPDMTVSQGQPWDVKEVIC